MNSLLAQLEALGRPGGEYFPLGLMFNRRSWRKYALEEILALPPGSPELYHLRVLALGLSRHPGFSGVSAGQLRAMALLNRAMRHLIGLYLAERACRMGADGIRIAGRPWKQADLRPATDAFMETHPPEPVLRRTLSEEELARPEARTLLRPLALTELFLLANQMENPALWEVKELFDDGELSKKVAWRPALAELNQSLAGESGGRFAGISLLHLLRAPIEQAPADLAGQLDYICRNWGGFLPPELQDQLQLAGDLVREEFRPRGFGPGETKVMRFDGAGDFGVNYHYEEHEAFTADRDWMPEVVMMAKMVYVWLDQLSKEYGAELAHLDDIPDAELDRLKGRGFNCLWLIGLWERSEASRRIKQIKGNPEAAASAYSLYDYVIASDLGGEEALHRLRGRCEKRGIRLAADVVPNHTGIDSRWIRRHPHWFIQSPYSPFPTYRFTGPNLSGTSDLCIQIEDGYYDHSEAAVVFRLEDYRSGTVRYIYHGNDGTHMPWNDTAQLNFLIPEVREAVIGTLLHVARTFKVIRFDAAMTLAKKHYQRLWFPQPGGGSGIASRAEHSMSREEFDRVFPKEFWREVVDRVAQEVPDCLLLAEAFWLMEGYFVRTLGMHRVYNSAFMNMLKKEENAKYREVIKNILEFDPDILGRFVNFMNNPDEETAVAQFGSGAKYFGVAAMMSTLPGLPMFGHGQIEGRHEKYGMEYLRARWDEPVDTAKLRHHEAVIFPLLRRRRIFSGSEHFALFDFWCEGRVDENVFAYSNRSKDERALVVYNNRYGDTRGWVKLSVGIREKHSGQLRRRSLMEALGLEAGEDLYIAFAEQACGLVHLMPSRKLAEEGLHLELSAYQSRALLDFRMLRDEDGSWGRLEGHLRGRGVKNLEDERKKLLYAPLHQAMAKLLKTPGEPAEDEPPATEPQKTGLMEELIGALGSLPGVEAKQLPDLDTLESLRARCDSAQKKLPEEMPDAASLLLPLLLLEMLAGEKAAPTALTELWERYLLAHPLEEALGDRRELPLCLALLRKVEREDFPPAAYLALPLVREFLGCNSYKEVLWFNRERLELLTEAALLAHQLLPTDPQAPTPAQAERFKRRILHRAQASGYQFDLFLQRMGCAPDDKAPPQEAPVP